MEGPKGRTDAEEKFYQERLRREKAPDSREDWYGETDPHADDLEKDADPKSPLDKAVEEEKEELKYRRPE